MERAKVPWPGWHIVKPLGHGGFGQVYEIERNVFGKNEKAAMKIITIPRDESMINADRSDGYDADGIREKYRSYLRDIVKEYQFMSELKGHSNIVSCDDLYTEERSGSIGWNVYIRMELLTPLLSKLQGHSMAEADIIRLGQDICRALTVCEGKNIIHRDIKPENIMISNFGGYKLGDFGIARTMDHSTHATRTGTVRYMAPEVFKGEKYGRDVDMYSLGLVMYWLLNKRRMPFLPTNRVPTFQETDKAHSRRIHGEPIPPPVNGNPELKKIVLKACSYDKKERFQSAQEMLTALENVSRSYAGPAETASKADRPRSSSPKSSSQGIKHYYPYCMKTPPAGVLIPHSFAAGVGFIAGLKPDGTVILTRDSGILLEDLEDWTHMVSLSACGSVLMGLRADGNVFAIDRFCHTGGQAAHLFNGQIMGWYDMTAIAAGKRHIVGVRSDGTVLAVSAPGSKQSDYKGECDVSGWSRVSAVAAAISHTVGLREDGRVYAAGSNDFGECDVSDWTDIVAVSAGTNFTLGLRTDGQILATGCKRHFGSVKTWKNVSAIAAGEYYAAGWENGDTLHVSGVRGRYYLVSRCSEGYWDNTIALDAGGMNTVALCSDGSILTSDDAYREEISHWHLWVP